MDVLLTIYLVVGTSITLFGVLEGESIGVCVLCGILWPAVIVFLLISVSKRK